MADLYQLQQAVLLKSFKLKECNLHFQRPPICINSAIAGGFEYLKIPCELPSVYIIKWQASVFQSPWANKQTFPVGSVTLAPMMSSFWLDLTLLLCKLFYSLSRDCDSKGCTRAMLAGCGPKLCTADFVDVNLWSHLLYRKRKNYLPLTYMTVGHI